MNFSPLMGKFEGRYSLIAGTFFSTANASRSVNNMFSYVSNKRNRGKIHTKVQSRETTITFLTGSR